ncbi:MAG: competence/damage-inducible protein A [Gemmatimonadetes bacterium]|nr:competence/damage-inducible protein A [Gemmatimonadota bacterium]
MAVRNFVEIVTVGDEILLGATLDTNAAFLARESARAGFEVRRTTTLPDAPEPLREGFREARGRGGAVLVTGGLGPTPDDLTRWALAEAFGRSLRLVPELLSELEEKFRAFGYVTPPAGNATQAELPEGAVPLPNARGTAPGMLVEDDHAAFFAMPGVPHEMEIMFREQVLPRLRARAGPGLVEVRQRVLRTAGIGESALAERVADLLDGREAPKVAFLPHGGSVDLRLTAAGLLPAAAERVLGELEWALAERLSPWVYGRDDETLGGAVGRALAGAGLSLATAESCTGGLIADTITNEPGSSSWFLGGVVGYANEAKRDLLGVSWETLERAGAVSADTCVEMLAGARARFGAECSLAVTGIAGPGGATATKPVGLVHFGVDVAGAVRLERATWPGTRRGIKQRAAKAALLLLLRAVEARGHGERGAGDARGRGDARVAEGGGRGGGEAGEERG